MQMNPGTRLGPYEITAPLGAGGMGEVYRARDTRLDRDVAVKVLPQHLSENAEVRARFEREAKTVSSLNHPNICTLFDVGREGDTDYLVMELIEGETLASRLGSGPVPLADTLRIGAEIADALDRAHRAGVVHRDLKPGNIMLTKSGAKLMDFGLARATGLSGESQSGVTVADLTQSPTMAEPLTAEGTIVGTFQYMAPEQLEGKEADARSDIWALGCVLYEMATGRRAFEGKSQASLIGAIMNAVPAPVSQIAPMSPPALERLVNACLAKDSADRVQSAHDVRLQLAWIAEGGSTPSGIGPAPATRRRRRAWPVPVVVGVVAVAATVLATSWVLRGRSAAPAGPLERYILGTARLDYSSTPIVTPDGRTVFYCQTDGTSRRIMRRPLASFDATPVNGTEGGIAPFLSPDGAWLGFATDNAIKKVPIDGGAPQTIASIAQVGSAEWAPDGMILYTLRGNGPDGRIAVGRVSTSSGRAGVAMPADTSRTLEYWLPEVLPDGKSFLISLGASKEWRIDAVMAGGERHTVVKDAFLGRYVPPEYLLWVDVESQAMLAAPFDPAKAVVTGTAFPLTGKVDLLYCYDSSREGTIVFVPQASEGKTDIVWVDRKGTVSPLTTVEGSWRQPRISPDGDRLVVRKVGIDCELWMIDLKRGGMAQITSIGDNHDPVWAPDGRRVACRSAQADAISLVTINVDAGRAGETLLANAGGVLASSWSADGKLLACTQSGREIVILPVTGDNRTPTPWMPDTGSKSHPAFSPDGRWIAYQSNVPGRQEVFLAAYPKPGRVYQVSTGGGNSPLWSRDGKELFFVSHDKFMTVSVTTSPELRLGLPQELFGGDFAWDIADNYDVTPDGKRFVMIRQSSATFGDKQLRVVRNWRSEIENRRGK